MSYEEAGYGGNMYSVVAMSKKGERNDSSSAPIATAYRESEVSGSAASTSVHPVTDTATSPPPLPPPFESTYNTLDYNLADSSTSKGAINKKNTSFKFKVVVVIFAVVMMVAMVLCLVTSFVAIAGNSTLKQQLNDTNTVLQKLNDSNTMLQQQLDTGLLTGRYPFNPAASCAALPPSFPSGYYWVTSSNGSAVSVYCNMTLSCGGVTGGWMRVAELDMTNSNQQCPSGLMERTDSHNDSSEIRTCVRNEASAGCTSVEVSTDKTQYSRVCGRITAYQVGRPNQFRQPEAASRERPTDIDSQYVDGVSLTHGTSTREHIWSFAAARDEGQTCHCTNNIEGNSPPDFVGQDYFCEAGSVLDEDAIAGILLPDDPLWDGAGCTAGNTCCSFNNPPWFYKQLPQLTTDNIEMRVCRDTGSDNEDVAIERLEIYIRV